MGQTLELKQELVRICHLLYGRNLVAATDGNISVRLEDKIFTTPSGINKGFIGVEDILTVNLDGDVIEGEGRPTTELQMHLTAYHVRPDIKAVVHAHPPLATAFSIAGISLEEGILPEVVLTLGGIPTAPYATTGTPAVSEAIQGLIIYYDALLLAQHGALTLGRDLMDAYNKMEKVEHTALVVLTAMQLGEARPLPALEVEKLTRMGISKGYRPPQAAKIKSAFFNRKLKTEN